jgi:putative restriction endonuclease
MTQLSLSDIANKERTRRLGLWEKFCAENDHDDVEKQTLRDLGIYGGAQGIWYDKKTTSKVIESGLTVSILHTGVDYEDDLFDDGLIYDYPSTDRPPGRDKAEIQATKAASNLGMPIFAILPSEQSASRRRVELARVEDSSELEHHFLIAFTESDFSPQYETTEDDFNLTDLNPPKKTKSKSARGVRQQKFRDNVLRNYGPSCAFCSITEPKLLDAGHIRPVKKQGSYHVGNGLPMCPSHNRGFNKFVRIEPSTHAIVVESPLQIGVTRTDILHLSDLPHPSALEWAWENSDD